MLRAHQGRSRRGISPATPVKLTVSLAALAEIPPRVEDAAVGPGDDQRRGVPGRASARSHPGRDRDGGQRERVVGRRLHADGKMLGQQRFEGPEAIGLPVRQCPVGLGERRPAVLHDLGHRKAQLALEVVDKEHGAAVAVGIIVATDRPARLQRASGEVLRDPVLTELRIRHRAGGVDRGVRGEPCVDKAVAVLRVHQLRRHPGQAFTAAVPRTPRPFVSHQDFDHFGDENPQNTIVGCAELRVYPHLGVAGRIPGVAASPDALGQRDDNAVRRPEPCSHRNTEPLTQHGVIGLAASLECRGTLLHAGKLTRPRVFRRVELDLEIRRQQGGKCHVGLP